MSRSRKPVGQGLFAHVLGFLCCVGLPAFVSAIAPVSVVRLVRENEQVTGHVSNRCFFAIPYRRMVVEDVRAVDDRFREGERIKRSGGRQTEQRAESESFLILHGRDHAVAVPVSPVNIRKVCDQAQEFLARPEKTDLRLTMVANWKFGVMVPVLLSPLTVLYVAGVGLTIWRLGKPKK